MADVRTDPLPYRREFGPLLADLLGDPLSSLTRTRQTSLLTAATITLLLAYGLATLKQEPSGVLSFINTSSPVAVRLGLAVTVYLLVSYILGAWTDLNVAKLKGWLPRGAVADIESKMKKDRDRRGQVAQSRIDKALRLNEEQHAIVAAYEQQSAPLWTRSTDVGRQLDAMPSFGTGSEQRRPLEAELSQLREQLKALADTRKQRMDMILIALEELKERSTLDEVWTMLDEQRVLGGGLKAVRNTTVARVVIEVAFPIVYSVIAVGLVVWRLIYC